MTVVAAAATAVGVWRNCARRGRCRRHRPRLLRFADSVSQEGRTVEAEDVLGDGKLLKRVLVKAQDDAENPLLGDAVSVHYVGTLENGDVFDSSRDRDEPFTFRLGLGQVIKGWDEGVNTMLKGERAEFTIHPDLAYGPSGAGDIIPGNATLKFDVELIDIDDTVEDDDEDADDDFADVDELNAGDDGDLGYGRDDLGHGGEDPERRFYWERRGTEVVVVAPLVSDVTSKDVSSVFKTASVCVKVAGDVLIEGVPGCELDWEDCWWEIDEDKSGKRCLFIHLAKKAALTARWPNTLLKEA